MAAGKAYLDPTGWQGIPGEVVVYSDVVDDGTLSLSPGTLPQRALRLPVYKDGSGWFCLFPVDPATITGMAGKYS